jgi:hypothetical protein
VSKASTVNFEVEFPSLPSVSDSQNIHHAVSLHSSLGHSRSAEVIATRQSQFAMFPDAALRDLSANRRPSSGTAKSMASARRKLLDSFVLTRSFVDESTSGRKHSPTTTRCSSLPITSKRSLMGLTGSGSRTSNDIVPSAAGSSHNVAVSSGKFRLTTSSATGPTVSLAEILAEAEAKFEGSPAVNCSPACDTQAAEVAGKMKLIPLALPGDDQRLRQLSGVSSFVRS